MFKKTLFALAAVALLSSPVIAAPGGGKGGGQGAGASAGMGMSKGGGNHMGMGGGHHSGHMNSNGIGTTGRHLGMDRAAERRSDAGILNSNNPRSATRATGEARADDRHDLNAISPVTRDDRVAEAYARWQRNHLR